MKTPKQLTPKAKQQQATPNSAGKFKKANKKAQKNTPQGTTTPSSAFKAMMQKTPKSDGIAQSNGQTPAKKGLRTPRLQGKVIKREDAQTPGKTIALANKVQNKTASAQKPKQQVKTDERAQSPGDEPESTPPKQAKTSPSPMKEGLSKPKRVRSLEKRLESRQLRRQNKKNVLSKLKSADPATLEEDAAKFELKLAALRDRSNLSKSAQRTVRRYKKYLKVIESIKAGDANVSDLNKSALEHLNSMKKAKPKKQQGESVKNEIGSSKKKKQRKYEVFVKNLPFGVETGAILLHFEEAGEVLNVTVPTGKKGIAYVEFPDEETCQEALKLNQTVLNGREIHVVRKGAPGGAKKSPKKT